MVVPHAGIEPALLSELDFESSASTSSANGARHCSHRRLHDAPAGGNRQIGVQRAITYPCGAFTMWPYLIELGAVSPARPPARLDDPDDGFSYSFPQGFRRPSFARHGRDRRGRARLRAYRRLHSLCALPFAARPLLLRHSGRRRGAAFRPLQRTGLADAAAAGDLEARPGDLMRRQRDDDDR